jgi:hypothetical protein
MRENRSGSIQARPLTNEHLLYSEDKIKQGHQSTRLTLANESQALID